MSALRRSASLRAHCLRAMATAALIALAAGPFAQARAAEAAQAVPGTRPAWTLDRLMSTLAQRKSGHASFTETKYLSIATQPVESSGELVFVAPDHLEKITQSPKPEHLVVDGDMLSVERENHTYTLVLARYPELGAFIESLRATLAGNRFALEQVYKVALAGEGDDWTLTLTPLDSRMRKVVSTITIDGTGNALRTVAIQQADGDHSLMRLHALAADTH